MGQAQIRKRAQNQRAVQVLESQKIYEKILQNKTFVSTLSKDSPSWRKSGGLLYRLRPKGRIGLVYETYRLQQFVSNFFFSCYLRLLLYFSLYFRYPSVCTILENMFPSGKPQTIIHPFDLEKVTVSTDGVFFGDEKIEGLIHAEIAVKQTFYPFLQYRAHGKSYCALCKTCVETMNGKPCQCKETNKRYFCLHFS